jgi:hypothetical protein
MPIEQMIHRLGKAFDIPSDPQFVNGYALDDLSDPSELADGDPGPYQTITKDCAEAQLRDGDGGIERLPYDDPLRGPILRLQHVNRAQRDRIGYPSQVRKDLDLRLHPAVQILADSKPLGTQPDTWLGCRIDRNDIVCNQLGSVSDERCRQSRCAIVSRRHEGHRFTIHDHGASMETKDPGGLKGER